MSTEDVVRFEGYSAPVGSTAADDLEEARRYRESPAWDRDPDVQFNCAMACADALRHGARYEEEAG